MKYCPKCKQEKSKELFYKNKNTKDGLSSYCRVCMCKIYKDKREQILKQQKEYNKTEQRKYQQKEWYINNMQTQNRSQKIKKQNNVCLYLDCIFRNRLYKSFIYNRGFESWEQLVDYNWEQLKEHLESQFTPEMNWNNYGEYWKLDHIIPKSQFYYDNFECRDFRICWSLMNLRPLNKYENAQRCRDGRDISEDLKQQILNQKFGDDIV